MRKVLSERERLQSFSAKDLKDTVRTTIIPTGTHRGYHQRFEKELNITAVKRQPKTVFFGYTGTIINLRTQKGSSARYRSIPRG